MADDRNTRPGTSEDSPSGKNKPGSKLGSKPGSKPGSVGKDLASSKLGGKSGSALSSVGGQRAKKAVQLTQKGLSASPGKGGAEQQATGTQKAKASVRHIAKQTASGAAGKNLSGKAFGAGATGAIAGAVQGTLEVIPKKWLLAILASPFAIALIYWIVIISVLTSFLGTNLVDQAVSSDHASAALSGISASDLTTIQTAVAGTKTPWELLVAALYYETGNGASVGQDVGQCPAGARPNSVCPAVSALLASPSGAANGGTGGVGSVSTEGTAPPPSPTSGFDPKVGRNGMVPRLLPANSPDWTTTDTADWDCIRQAESGDNYTNQSGAYGFLQSTWSYYGEPGTPGQASKTRQNALALTILNAEGHFYGAWNDACTRSGGETENPISYIPPGVADPTGAQGPTVPGGGSGAGAATVSPVGGCITGVGPYCLAGATPGATVAGSLAASSKWIAQQVGTAIVQGGADGNLSDGTTLYSVTEPPTLDTSTNFGAKTNQQVIEAALNALPFADNSLTLDANIYELAVDLSVGYTPSTANGATPCITPTPIMGSTTIQGPTNGGTQSAIILTSAQTALAQQIVTAAGNASLLDIEAALTGALGTSQLSGTSGVFGDGNTNVASAVQAFLAAAQPLTGSPAAIAAIVLNQPLASLSGWEAGATTLALADTKTPPACSSNAPLPVVTGGSPQARAAIKAAEAEIGMPYVWGGGGTNGPSGAASTCSGGVVATGQVGAGNPCTSTYAAQAGQPGFDCSGLVQYAYAKAGVQLPRTSEEQYAALTQQETLTTQVSQLQPGDLLFYSFTGTADHVAIYLGDNELIQAPETGQDVQVVPFYSTDFIGGGPA